ncbi:hypothetical protein AB0B50_15935 [Streptomyces sp. NPDC041068]|uniref:hypothetical protein n=1 Tax=Streptomyces sp. NPDC041068 TaxID=3155130 RepID=UPI0033D5A989
MYGVVLMLGLHAASVTRPHVLSPDALRVRKGAHLDLRIPLALITTVRLHADQPAELLAALKERLGARPPHAGAN